MFRNIFVLILLLISRESFSQNLVPNSDFETHVPCSLACCGITKAPPWFSNASNAAYYFNPCINIAFLYFSVPRNLADTTGYQWPVSGISYAGFNVYHNQTTNFRQYIEVKLIDTLKANRQYCVDFYVNLCNNSRNGTDGIGACLTDDTLNCVLPSFSCLITATPQIVSPPGVPIIDTLNWTKISGVFTAIGNEQFITIGNFLPDSLLTLGFNDSTSLKSSFYYIDDVSVTLCDSSSGVNDIFKEQEINLFPNPANDLIHISSKKQIEEIVLLDVSGKEILKQKYAKTIDISNVADGLYLLRFKFQNGKIGYEKIVVQHEK